MITDQSEGQKPTLTDRLRAIFKIPLDLIGGFLNKVGMTANLMTFLGFAGTSAGAYLVSQGQLTVGGIVILAMGGFDALDGAVARAGGEASRFGAFLDSVLDRYGEMVIYAALLWYFAGAEDGAGQILAFLAFSGSVLVSYTRARAESLGVSTKVGLLTRVERMIVIAPCIIFQVPLQGTAIVALLANFTALQRILDVRKKLQEAEKAEG